MHVNAIADSAMWDSATTDHDAVEHRGLVVRATVALAGTWPFLAASGSMEEFEHRLALMQEQIEARTPAEIRNEVVAGLRGKFAELQNERLTTTAMVRTAARTIAKVEGDESLPQAYVHVHKHGSGDDEYHQVDFVGGQNFLQTIGHMSDRDQAMTTARQYALPNGLPLYENGRYVEGKRLRSLFQPDEEFFDAKTGSWVPVSALPNAQASGPSFREGMPGMGNGWQADLLQPEDWRNGQWVPGSHQGYQAGLQATAHQSWAPGGTGLHPAAGIADEAARARRDANWGTHLASDPTQVNRAPGTSGYQPDPDQAWRYHYPIPAPTLAQGGQPSAPGSGTIDVASQAAGSSIGADGFPIDVAQGEAAAGQAKIQEQITPGAWTVTPGTEWPVRQNAGHPGEKVYASKQSGGHKSTDDFYSYNSYGGEDQSGRAPSIPCPSCGGTGGDTMPCRQCSGHGSVKPNGQAIYPYPHEASRRQATEGIAPTPGANPNYFSQGTQGLAGPAQFPQNPSGDIEPKTNNHMDGDGPYGDVPPMVSPGSAQGQTDGGGYSRQGVNAAKKAPDVHMTLEPKRLNFDTGPVDGYDVHLHHPDRPEQFRGSGDAGDHHFNVGWWPTHEKATEQANAYGETYRQGWGLKNPVTVRQAAKSPDFSRSAGERTLAAEARNRDSDYWDDIDRNYSDDRPDARELAESQQYDQAAARRRTPEENDEIDRRWGLGEHRRSSGRNLDLPSGNSTDIKSTHTDRYVGWAHDKGHDPDDLKTLLKYEREPGIGRSTTNHIADQYMLEGDDWRERARHGSLSVRASTNGQIVGKCDHCGHPVRYHDDDGGHLRHLHSNSPMCADGRKATAMRVVQAGVEYRLPVAQGAVIENPSANNPTGRGADPYRAKTDFEGFEKQRPRQNLEDMNVNTPTTAPAPIQQGRNVNTPLPGGTTDDEDGPRERDDEDDD